MAKQQETEQQRKEWNESLFKHIKELKKIKAPCVDDPKDVRRACDEYLQLCEDTSTKPTVAGLSMALGVNRNILRKWISGEVTIQTADIVTEFYSIIEIFDETALKENKTNAVAGLFNMKNNFGYKDEVEVRHVDDRKPSIKEIEERLRKRQAILDAQPSALIESKPAVIDVEPPVEENTPATQEMIDKGYLNDDDDIPF